MTDQSMGNGDTAAAKGFHQATKLSYINLSTKPPLYKSYSGLPTIPLPQPIAGPDMPVLEALTNSSPDASQVLDLEGVAQLLHFSGGLIRKSNLKVAGEVHYRAAASAGALYPIELYLVCADLPGLDAGVYHYSPESESLTQLRRGDFRGHLAGACADEDAVSEAPVIIVSTAVFWRSAWKYRERGYRYCFWDNGTVLANLLAVSRSLGLPARGVAGFVDREVDLLLGLDSEREASTCLVPLGAGRPAPAASGVPEPLNPTDLEDKYRLIYSETQRLHQSSCLTNGQEVTGWRSDGQGRPSPSRGPATVGSTGAEEAFLPSLPLAEVISKRGSTRRFAREAIEYHQLLMLMNTAIKQSPFDFQPAGSGLLDTYLIVNSVNDLASGAYFVKAGVGNQSCQLELLEAGDFREEAGHLCFEQALGADASVVAFFLADLDDILGKLGNRGYRAAQLEAGLLGGNMYLASHSLGLGATGMTFFDDTVTAFFSPHAAGKSLMFLVGLGRTATPNQVHPFRSRIGILKDSLARGAGGGERTAPDWLYS